MAAQVLAPRDAWGLRALVVESANGPVRGPGASPRPAGSFVDRLAEVWVDAQPTGIGAPEPQPSAVGQVFSDSVLVPTGGSSVAAIGVTSPNRQPIIDIRLWAIIRGAATRVEVLDLPGSAPGIERLLVPPASLSPTGDWPAGTYHFDLLVGQRVFGMTMVLPFRPHNQEVIARVAQLAAGLPEGVFVVRPESNNNPDAQLTARMVPDSPVSGLTNASAWLQLSGGGALGAEASAVVLTADPAVVAIGIHGPIGEQLTSQIMINLAPLTGAQGTFGAVVVPAATGDVAVFELTNGGLQPGLFRLDTGWALQNGWRGRSWFLDVGSTRGGQDSTAPLLAAAREWAPWAGRNVVLAAGQNPVEQLPSDVAADSDELGPSCIGGVMIGPGTKVVGIGYAGSRAGDVLVHRLFTGGRTVPITAAVAADTVAGLLLMADARSEAWRPGYYEVAIVRDGAPARYVFCVGERGSRGLLSVPPDAGGVDAYRDAIAQ
jgi:hypothetical protein